jgi:hypothetical protein
MKPHRAQGVRGFSYRRVRTTRRDAADLADLLRVGRLPEPWIAPREIRGAARLTAAGPSSQPQDISTGFRLWPWMHFSRGMALRKIGK